MRKELCCGGLGAPEAVATRIGAAAAGDALAEVATRTGTGAAATAGAGAGAGTGTGAGLTGLDGIETRMCPGEADAVGAGAVSAAAGAAAMAGTAVAETIGTAGAPAAAAAAICPRISAFASSRALALQPGQFTFTGIRPLTGSTSKANFVPHGHWIFTFILRVSDSIARPWGCWSKRKRNAPGWTGRFHRKTSHFRRIGGGCYRAFCRRWKTKARRLALNLY